MICKICSSSSEQFSSAIILHKHEIKYFKCTLCGYIQTETPFWLEDAYTEAINRSDVGHVSRNITLSTITKSVITLFYNNSAKFVDFGGGYGMMVRLMRDSGFDYYRYDRYCENLFAADFEASKVSDSSYELLTAFEVFEHLLDPIAEIEQMLALSRDIFFSTLLLPDDTPDPKSWWYYGLDHGQHVSFFTKQ